MLDALVQCSTIAFDKTGTLTTGNLSCTGLVTPGQAVSQTLSSNGEQPAFWRRTLSHIHS